MYAALGTFWPPASHRFASAGMLRPIRHTSQIEQAGQTRKEPQQVCDADVLLLPVHTEMYAEDVSSPVHIYHPLWCWLTYLCLLLCNAEQLCCALTVRTNGTLCYCSDYTRKTDKLLAVVFVATVWASCCASWDKALREGWTPRHHHTNNLKRDSCLTALHFPWKWAFWPNHTASGSFFLQCFLMSSMFPIQDTLKQCHVYLWLFELR